MHEESVQQIIFRAEINERCSKMLDQVGSRHSSYSSIFVLLPRILNGNKREYGKCISVIQVFNYF